MANATEVDWDVIDEIDSVIEVFAIERRGKRMRERERMVERRRENGYRVNLYNVIGRKSKNI